MSKVVHLTSVHSADDPRIFGKECTSLADAGFDVVLIAPHERDDLRNGVRVQAVSPPRDRLRRVTRTAWQIYRAAGDIDADAYHIHDPELIPIGLLLRLHGKKVVYDVHEDYVTSIRQKDYLPDLVRGPLSMLFGMLERLAAKSLTIVLAERYYLERFPAGKLVLNYPRHELLPSQGAQRSSSADEIRLLYTGVVSRDRGALIHASLVNLGNDVHVHVIGRCDADLTARMRRVAGHGRQRLHITGEGTHVPYQTMIDTYQTNGWTAGLALFPDTPHYRYKELTKFFEYMAAGIPIICSNFRTWVSLIEGIGCGICVDPGDSAAILAAIRYLVDHPDRAAEMGRRGRHAVDTRYNWTREAKTLIKLYRQALGLAPAAQRSTATL